MSISSADVYPLIDLLSASKHDLRVLCEIEEDDALKQIFAKNEIPGTVRSTVHSPDRGITSPSDNLDLKKAGIHGNSNINRLKFTWKKGQVIGEGSFGRVYKGINDSTGHL